MPHRRGPVSAGLALILGTGLLAGCGKAQAPASTSTPTPEPSPSATARATASASPSAELLYAVLESHTKSTSGFVPFDTVAIAGLDGYARARTTFTPLTAPYVGCLGPLFAPQAHTAAGQAFFIDGKGVVRSLGVDKSVTTVATFSIGTQQEASFAVSPDGKHLLGTILTLPPRASSGDPCSAAGTGFAPGNWSEDVYAADAGASARSISHRTWPQSQPENILSLVGWDALGPLATFPSSYGTQGGGPIREGWYGNVVRVDPTSGTITRPLGTNDCFVGDVSADGHYVCAESDGIHVFNPDGTADWKFATPTNEGLALPLLAPDLQRVEALGPAVLGRDGSNLPIGHPRNGGTVSAGFYCTGWLDNQTLIGLTPVSGTDQVAVVHLSAPSQIVNLGFRGTFVGVVTPS